MSELAFNLSGEPFELPSAAIGWRVRKMKPKGAPEVVYSRDGIPLILPIEADIDDLRRAARSDGRYRVDPVDEHNRMIAGAPAGYVCVQPSEVNSDAAPLASRATSDNVAIEAMKLNTELAKTIVDRFPMMMEAAAALLRAADGAGLPAREPRPIPSVEVEEEDDDDQIDEEDDDELDDVPTAEPAARPSTLQAIVETLAPYVMPALMSAIAGGKIKIPGGIAAFLDPRPPSAKARATAAPRTTHARSTPGAGPAPGPRDPAPAAGGVAPSHVAARRVAVPTASPSSVPAAPRAVSKPTAPAPTRAVTPPHPAASATATAPIRAAAPTEGSPTAALVMSPIHVVPIRPPAPTEGSPAASPVISSIRIEAHGDAAPARSELSSADTPHVADAPVQTRHFDEGMSVPALEPAQTPPTRANAAAADAAAGVDAEADDDDEASSEPSLADDASEDAVAIAPESDTAPDDELPTLDADALAHFAAIQGALTFREGMLARALAAELSPDDVRVWLSDLVRLSVPEAVAKIRGVLGTDESGNDTGGVS